jgi:hypothetical protein
VVVGVDHPGDDEMVRAVDPLPLCRRVGDDSTVGDRQIAPAELTSADVHKAVL